MSVPPPVEAAVTAGGMGAFQEENEPVIDRMQIDCTVMGWVNTVQMQSGF